MALVLVILKRFFIHILNSGNIVDNPNCNDNGTEERRLHVENRMNFENAAVLDAILYVFLKGPVLLSIR